jgi:coenzyme F420-reducing hydrogenase delta subunit/ferredoxin
LNRILVVGGDETGLQLADGLAAEGFKVLLLNDSSRALAAQGINALADAVIETVQGFVGDFELTLRTASGRMRERVGFIVAAPPEKRLPMFDAYGLARTPRVLSLSDVETLLAARKSLEPRRGEWFHAAFLCGLNTEAEPAQFERVLDAISRLEEMGNFQSYVFTRNVKVAATGLERRYRDTREHGTIFFKFDADSPRFEDSPDGLLMVFTEPLLGIEVELLPDLVVVDEQTSPSPSLQPILDAMPSAAAYAPFLQPESTRFAGVETAKVGILAVGASRGMADPAIIRGDVDAVVTWLKRFLDGAAPSAPSGPAEVDPGKCTICLTCVRLCPHGAISFHKAAEVDPTSCARCGICAVECPNRAISLVPQPGAMDISAQMKSALTCFESNPFKIVAFLCSRSAAQAFDQLPAAIRRKMAPVVVPCAGSLDPAHLLEALQEGADGVLAAGCFAGNCASIYGTVLAQERVQQVSGALHDMGLDGEAIEFVQVAGNAAPALARGVLDLERRLLAGAAQLEGK